MLPSGQVEVERHETNSGQALCAVRAHGLEEGRGIEAGEGADVDDGPDRFTRRGREPC
jgi:hypothetical protein